MAANPISVIPTAVERPTVTVEEAAHWMVGRDALHRAVDDLARDLRFAVNTAGSFERAPMWWVEIAAPLRTSVPGVGRRFELLDWSVRAHERDPSPGDSTLIDEYQRLVRPRAVEIDEPSPEAPAAPAPRRKVGRPNVVWDAFDEDERPIVRRHIEELELRNLRPGYVRNRLTILSQFRRKSARRLLDVGKEELAEFLHDLNLTAESRAVRFSHVDEFYRWAQREGLVEANLAANMIRPRKRRRLPRPMPDDELARALTDAPPRVRSILHLAALAGLRCGEIARVERASGAVIIGGLILGGLVLLVRTSSPVISIDHHISQWVNDHDTSFTHSVMNGLTHLGAGEYVVGFAIVVAIEEYIRLRNRWIVPFLAVLLIGESFITTTVKNLLDRARPTLNPSAHFLGPAFPSGHTVTAAAFYAGAALLLGRTRGRRAHAVLIAAAVGLAVGVACTRVLLDEHWFSDVVGGLALGWAWFAMCSIAFGGRLLHFGAPVEIAERAPTTRHRADGREHLTTQPRELDASTGENMRTA